ncbi:MAG: sce7725 family protein [Bacteroidales bacterium]|nr:sce7725 family protein [Candidatus Colicola caccequi]
MYYPLLRAKQYDLKAVREFIEENEGQKKILPILEPVNSQNNALILTINALMKVGQKFALVLNPMDGMFKHPTVRFTLLDECPLLRDKREMWVPAFICNRDLENVENLIIEEGYEHVMLIHPTGFNVENEKALEILRKPQVEYIVNNFGSSTSRRTGRILKDTGKKIIRLDDMFNTQQRNADYLNNVDELFSEEWYYYKEEGGLDGFSDYTSVQKELTEGGAMPYALAIHLTYLHSDDQVYIHHFVSDSNDTQADVRGKFCEAAIKVRDFYIDKPHTTPIDDIIERSGSREGYPGLGYLKKVSIKNHLELMLSLL